MRAFPLLLAVCLGALACQTAGPDAAGTAGPPDGVELTAVIDAVREAIVEAQTREVPGFPALKAISVKMQTTVSRSAGGEVRYLVISAGGRVSSDTTSRLELDLKPPEISHTRPLLPKETLKDALAQAIHLAKVGVASAAKGDPPLQIKSIAIDLKFTVAAEGSAGGKVQLLPIGVEGTAKISRERVHAVSLTYGP